MRFTALAGILLTLSGCLVTEGVVVGVGVSGGPPPYHHPGYARPYYAPRYWGPPPPPRYGYGYPYRPPYRYRGW